MKPCHTMHLAHTILSSAIHAMRSPNSGSNNSSNSLTEAVLRYSSHSQQPRLPLSMRCVLQNPDRTIPRIARMNLTTHLAHITSSSNTPAMCSSDAVPMPNYKPSISNTKQQQKTRAHISPTSLRQTLRRIPQIKKNRIAQRRKSATPPRPPALTAATASPRCWYPRIPHPKTASPAGFTTGG